MYCHTFKERGVLYKDMDVIGTVQFASFIIFTAIHVYMWMYPMPWSKDQVKTHGLSQLALVGLPFGWLLFMLHRAGVLDLPLVGGLIGRSSA